MSHTVILMNGLEKVFG